MPTPRGKRAGSKTPTVDYAAGCLVRSTSTKCPTKKSRTSSSPPISRPENAWASRPLSRRSSKSLAKTCKSGSLSLLHLDLESRLVHNFAPNKVVDRDRSVREILGVGPSFDFKILAQEDWTGRRLIADRFRDRRVFLCGDAAHIWVLFAGYGMNAGIA